jgi:hypothetical protein
MAGSSGGQARAMRLSLHAVLALAADLAMAIAQLPLVPQARSQRILLLDAGNMRSDNVLTKIWAAARCYVDAQDLRAAAKR